jgi:NarL family two-component system response regulator LiaR
MSSPIRLLIADDHALVRKGLRALIETKPDMLVVGEAAHGEEAITLAHSLRPDVILLDLLMPRKTGLEAILEIKRDNPDARILVLTSFAEDEKVLAAVKAGALGYLLKDASPQELLEAIRSVDRGEASLPSAIALRLIQEINRPSSLPPTDQPLTEREMEVLILVARGWTNQAIAEKLGISERTVGTHISNILGKLHLANRTQAALYALRTGLTSLDVNE